MNNPVKALWPPIVLTLLSLILAYSLHIIFLLGSLILFIDIKARYEEYVKLVNEKSEHKRMKRIDLMRASNCSRTAAIAAFPDLAKPHYAKLGYKWYHIFPDGAPQCFFSVKWWKRTLGIHKGGLK